MSDVPCRVQGLPGKKQRPAKGSSKNNNKQKGEGGKEICLERGAGQGAPTVHSTVKKKIHGGAGGGECD